MKRKTGTHFSKEFKTALIAGSGLLSVLGPYSASAWAQDGGLDEILVTAQKREERLQDVPATIVAFTADKLEARGITNVMDLQHTTPGMTFGSSAAWTNFYMRGLGNAFNTPSAQSPVAFYLDGVYVADVASTLFELDTVSQIEILKGPQGTLYGRNAVGGAININTKQPSPDTEIIGKITLGDFNEQKYSGYINGGTDLMQANLSVTRHTRDGFIENINPALPDRDEKDDWTFRGKLRLTPSETADITLSADYSRSTGNFPGWQPIDYTGTSVLPTGVLLGGTQPNQPWKTSEAIDPIHDQVNKGVGLTGRFNLGAVDLVSITAYREFDNFQGVDLDATDALGPQFYSDDFHDQFSQELQVLSTGSGPFSWIAGLYYLNDNAGFSPLQFNLFADLFPATGVRIDVFSKVRTNAYAVFGEGTYDFNDAWSVVAGLRYSIDKLTHYDSRQIVYDSTKTFTLASIDSSGSEASFYSLTPRLSITYTRPEGLYYITGSQGYSSGLFDISNVKPTIALDQAIDPTKVDALEIGAKWNLLNDAMRLNVSAFYYDAQSLQLQSLSGDGSTRFENADAKIQGIDFDVEWLVATGFSIRGAFEILDTEYTSYKQASIWTPNLGQGVTPCFLPPPAPPFTPESGSSPLSASCKVTTDLTGEPLMRSPEFTSTLGFDWDIPISETYGTLTLSSDWYHSDEFRTTSNATIVSPSYDTFNASLTLVSPGENWTLSIWGKNLSEAEYLTAGAETGYVREVQYGDPRTFGGTLSYRFGGQ